MFTFSVVLTNSLDCYIYIYIYIYIYTYIYIYIYIHDAFFDKQPGYEQLAPGWQVARELSGLNPLSLKATD